MTSIEQAESWIGRTAVDSNGEQIGRITRIWLDDASGEAEWASVKVVGPRGRETLVPLAGGAPFGGGRRFAYSREEILDAPHAGQDGRLEMEDKEELSSYYGTPATNPQGGSATWVDRLEDAAGGGTVREIRALLGDDGPAPAPQASVAQKVRRRFGRKSGSTS